MPTDIYRNESLIQMERYETDPQHADELITAVRGKWAMLRDKGHAGDYPVEILRSGGRVSMEASTNGHAEENGQTNGKGVITPRVEVVELFRWRSIQDRIAAESDPEYVRVQARIAALVPGVSKDTYTEAVRGFNTNFPGIGGVELLKGVCSCLLSIDGMVENYPMSVKNGIVLMHRSPRMDLDGDGRNEMYLKILMHGGETIQAALGPIRVEQNFSRPNDGIVKSNGTGDRDFPATAIWRVSWRIQTALGPVLTDPDQPLIFGPAAVDHYPPVGTHFHSATGPVKLVHEESGRRVGTLIPGELTAFDIVVTKDDEIFADMLNTPPPDLFPILDSYIARMDELAERFVTVGSS
jgi:hypothetical protein